VESGKYFTTEACQKTLLESTGLNTIREGIWSRSCVSFRSIGYCHLIPVLEIPQHINPSKASVFPPDLKNLHLLHRTTQFFLPKISKANKARKLDFLKQQINMFQKNLLTFTLFLIFGILEVFPSLALPSTPTSEIAEWISTRE
jgi:hypothetical protein